MDTSWQTVPCAKRPRLNSSEAAAESSAPSNDQNRFQILQTTDDDNNKHNNNNNNNNHNNNNNNKKNNNSSISSSSNNNSNNTSSSNNSNNNNEKTPKPPPIYFPNVTNVNKMIEQICEVMPIYEFVYKPVQNNEIRLMIHKIDYYRLLIKHLEQSKVNFHTYQIKQERSFRVVIKGLHFSTDINSIKNELTLSNHNVRNVRGSISRINKKPLNMFFVDLEPNVNNKDVYAIKHLNNAIVTVEPVRKTDDLVQCFRCQEFGHTQNYCRKPFRCVKCSLDHATSECPKTKDTPPKCAHCDLVHTANYKGCSVYQQLVKNKRPNVTQLRQAQPVNPNLSYSEAVRNNNSNPVDNNIPENNFNQNYNNTLINKVEQMIKTQNEFMNTMMQMMQVVINTLCKPN